WSTANEHSACACLDHRREYRCEFVLSSSLENQQVNSQGLTGCFDIGQFPLKCVVRWIGQYGDDAGIRNEVAQQLHSLGDKLASAEKSYPGKIFRRTTDWPPLSGRGPAASDRSCSRIFLRPRFTGPAGDRAHGRGPAKRPFEPVATVAGVPGGKKRSKSNFCDIYHNGHIVLRSHLRLEPLLRAFRRLSLRKFNCATVNREALRARRTVMAGTGRQSPRAAQQEVAV